MLTYHILTSFIVYRGSIDNVADLVKIGRLTYCRVVDDVIDSEIVHRYMFESFGYEDSKRLELYTENEFKEVIYQLHARYCNDFNTLLLHAEYISP